MKTLIPGPLLDRPDKLMQNAGYVFHCTEDGKPCYHRQISNEPFPRFHAYVTTNNQGMEIDLHIDQLNLDHSGNHQHEWAYEGGRVRTEMNRLIGIISGARGGKKVNQPKHSLNNPATEKPKRKKNLFDLIFKS